MARKMTFSGSKYNSRPADNGDKNEPGKNPKPTYKKMEGSDTPAKQRTAAENKKNASDAKKGPDIHPVTGRPMTDADRVKMNKELEYRKKAGLKTAYKGK
jgi:hypothetical protein